MIVKLEFVSDNGTPISEGKIKESALRGELGDSIIRAVDRAMQGASWRASGNGWVAQA